MPFGYSSYFDNIRYQAIFAKFIKYERNQQNLSIKELASIVGIDSSYLSAIENCKKCPSEIIVESLLDGLDVTFDFSVEKEKAFIQSFVNFYNTYDDMTYTQLDDASHLYSWAFPYVLLYRSMIYQSSSLDDSILDELQVYEDKSFQIVVFNSYIMNKCKDNHVDAYDIFNEFKQYLSNIGSVSSNTVLGELPLAILMWHAAMFCTDHNFLISGLQYAQEALSLSQNLLFIRGIFGAKEQIAKVYCATKEYLPGIQIYADLIHDTHINLCDEAKAIIYSMIGQLYLLHHNYVEAEKALYMSLELDDLTPTGRFLLILMYYVNNNVVEYEKAIVDYLGFNDETDALIGLLESIHHHDDSSIDSNYEKITDIDKSIDNCIRNIIFSYYVNKKEYEKACKYIQR